MRSILIFLSLFVFLGCTEKRQTVIMPEAKMFPEVFEDDYKTVKSKEEFQKENEQRQKILEEEEKSTQESDVTEEKKSSEANSTENESSTQE